MALIWYQLCKIFTNKNNWLKSVFKPLAWWWLFWSISFWSCVRTTQISL